MTGSNGKTTTKELIASIMNCYLGKGKVLVSKDNYNNDIGMPLTLLNLNKNHKYVILELGMNHVKEIDMLTRIAPPDVALITNIGEAHIENFKSKLDIAGAKKEIFNKRLIPFFMYDTFHFLGSLIVMYSPFRNSFFTRIKVIS